MCKIDPETDRRQTGYSRAVAAEPDQTSWLRVRTVRNGRSAKR
jgi:hypothetical protein